MGKGDISDFLSKSNYVHIHEVRVTYIYTMKEYTYYHLKDCCLCVAPAGLSLNSFY